MKTIDMVGKKFGTLEVLSVAKSNKHGQGKILCRCECGKVWETESYGVAVGNVVSCGCRRAARNASGIVNRTHGRRYTKEYRSWVHMRERCQKPNCKSYARYGAKGVSVCPEWASSFEAFFADMGLAPTPEHSIDRIDNDGNYKPSNCQWSTRREQALNRKRTLWYTHDGVTLCRKEWTQRLGVTPDVIELRIRKGMKFSEIVEYCRSQVKNQVKEII